jgi:hypothetical protein
VIREVPILVNIVPPVFHDNTESCENVIFSSIKILTIHEHYIMSSEIIKVSFTALHCLPDFGYSKNAMLDQNLIKTKYS